MKITDSDVIKNGERELIDAITGDLDWSAIEKIFKEKHKLRIQDDVEYRQGDIVVFNNQVAYKLDFDVKVTLSVLFDRMGNYLSFTTSGDFLGLTEEKSSPDIPPLESGAPEVRETIALEDAGPMPSADPEVQPNENVSQMASEIAEMISEINEDGER